MADIQSLIQNCSAEQKRFVRGEIDHSDSCYELFRHALELDDQEAWAGLYQQFISMIKVEVQRAKQKFRRCRTGNLELAEDAFVTMREKIPPEEFLNYRSLGVLLVFLQRAAWFEVMTCHRVAERSAKSSIGDASSTSLEVAGNPVGADRVLGTVEGRTTFEVRRPVEHQVIRSATEQELDECVYRRLKTKEETIVTAASFRYDMKPSEIADEFSKTVPDSREVYRIKGNVLERLGRDPQIRSLLGVEGEQM